MVDFEREKIESMIRGMSIEEKVVVWNILKDDEEIKNVLTEVAVDDAGPVTIEKLMQAVQRKMEGK